MNGHAALAIAQTGRVAFHHWAAVVSHGRSAWLLGCLRAYQTCFCLSTSQQRNTRPIFSARTHSAPAGRANRAGTMSPCALLPHKALPNSAHVMPGFSVSSPTNRISESPSGVEVSGDAVVISPIPFLQHVTFHFVTLVRHRQ